VSYGREICPAGRCGTVWGLFVRALLPSSIGLWSGMHALSARLPFRFNLVALPLAALLPVGPRHCRACCLPYGASYCRCRCRSRCLDAALQLAWIMPRAKMRNRHANT